MSAAPTHQTRRPLWAGGLAAAATLACVAVSSFASVAQAGLTPELESTLRVAPPIQRIPVIATLKDQAGPAAGRRPEEVLRALRRKAALTQPGLVTRLGLSQVRRYWIVNAVSVSALPVELDVLASDPGVARVDLDPAVVIEAAPAPRSRLLQAGGRNWGLEAVHAPAAWREVGVTGAGVSVGTIDTGVTDRHPALAGKVAAWRDVVSGGPAPYDDNGHGTHTAGTIAGGDAQSSQLGVAPGAKLLVAKAISGDGVGAGSDIIAAAQWLADPDDDPATADFPEVISNSWGEVSDPNDIWFRPVLRRWRDIGIVPVFAAGNTGPGAGSIGSPAGYPDALAVAAVDRAGSVVGFSSRGPIAWQNKDGLGPAAGSIAKPDIAGPGVDIVSSTPGGGYQAYSGTSMAAPHVAGVAALVRSVNPTLSGAAVERILGSTAIDLGVAGRDSETGEGLVDALAAAQAAAQLPGATTRARPTRRALRRRGTVELTVAQLRINRRIALAAIGRIARLETRLGTAPSGPNPVTAQSRLLIRRLSAVQMRLTQRISQSALRRAAAAQAHITSPSAVPVVAAARPRTGRVRLTVGQLLINQRIAQAALRQIVLAEAGAEGSGLIPRD